jgi:hypothetical protein
MAMEEDPMRHRLVGIVAAIGMILAACGSAMPDAAGPSEGIQVHGDWTIEIYNDDGSLDQRHEFSNALVNGGYITGTLGGVVTPGQWLIRLFGPDYTGGACNSADPTFGVCVLTASVETNAESITLTGSTTAETNATIAIVDTKPAICGSNVTPGDCLAQYDPAFDDSGLALTEKVLDPADQANVTTGQSIDVQVVISFTSG